MKALRWLAPSAVGALVGAVLGGLVESLVLGLGPLAALASAGFAAILNLPLAFVGAVAVRGLWAAWRPDRLGLVEDDGTAPRLAAWLVFLVVAAFALIGVSVAGVEWLARRTSFKPNVVALGVPLFTLAAVATFVAISRPVVDLLARVLPRVSPRVVLGAAFGLAAVAALAAWLLWLSPRLGPFDLTIAIDPLVAGAAAGLAHPLWRRLPSRRALALAAAATAATLGLAAAALWVRLERPSLLLAIWTERSVAGLAIDTAFDVDDLRDGLALDRARPVPRPGATHRDVVFVTIDTIRYDRTPLGGGTAAMPAFAALAQRGAVFDRAYAPSNATRRSMTSIILGLSPPRVHGREQGWALRLDPRHVPLAERIHLAGYDTAGFFCCEVTWSPSKKTGWSRGIDELSFGKDREIARDAAAWIADRYAHPNDRPAFVWVHLFEPHRWAASSKDAAVLAQPREQRAARYDKALVDVDRHLGTILAAIEAVPADRRPILVVTSDHGDGLGDHDALHHGYTLYDSETRVPLVILGPGIPAARIAETVSGTDLVPTILDLAGFEPPGLPTVDGHSFADLATGARAPDPDGGVAYLAMLKDRTTPRPARAIVRGPYKLLDAAHGLELYDTRADPTESHDLASERPALVDELRALLEERAALDRTSPF